MVRTTRSRLHLPISHFGLEVRLLERYYPLRRRLVYFASHFLPLEERRAALVFRDDWFRSSLTPNNIMGDCDVAEPTLTLDQIVEELEEAAALEGTEVGEYWQWLVDGYNKFLTKNMEKALEKELRFAYKHLINCYEVVEQSTSTVRKVLREK